MQIIKNSDKNLDQSKRCIMNSFKDKVAVITGAASGIGLGLSTYCAQNEMKVVLADVEKEALTKAEADLTASGADVTAVLTDVANLDQVKQLAQKTIETYDRVDLLFNNAGVVAGSSLWESSMNDCKWMIDVNLWGVINCIREFIPRMLQQKNKCHIINISSMAGLTSYHPSALYQLTKHGIVALSEQLHHDLEIRGANINVSVACPGAVKTNIMDAERNRPEIYMNALSGSAQNNEPDDAEIFFREMIKAGMPPLEFSEMVFKAIIEAKFYVFTHPELSPLAKLRMDTIVNEKNPVLPTMG